MSCKNRYIFFCINQRENKKCCGTESAKEVYDYAKKLSKISALQARVTYTGCLGRCREGPVLVIYPDAVWYTYSNTDDIDEIFHSHLQNCKIVERLKINN